MDIALLAGLILAAAAVAAATAVIAPTRRVVLAADFFHVVPAGEFTPADVSLTAVRDDLHRARDSGHLSVHVLGLGLDPLSLKPELLTVAVFGEEAFTGAFGDRIVGNYEGTVVQDEPFDAETVQGYLDLTNVRGGAKACLRLAWRNREFLGLA